MTRAGLELMFYLGTKRIKYASNLVNKKRYIDVERVRFHSFFIVISLGALNKRMCMYFSWHLNCAHTEVK